MTDRIDAHEVLLFARALPDDFGPLFGRDVVQVTTDLLDRLEAAEGERDRLRSALFVLRVLMDRPQFASREALDQWQSVITAVLAGVTDGGAKSPEAHVCHLDSGNDGEFSETTDG